MSISMKGSGWSGLLAGKCMVAMQCGSSVSRGQYLETGQGVVVYG